MKRFVVNLSNAEEMKKSYTSPQSLVIQLESEFVLTVNSPNSIEGDPMGSGEDDENQELFPNL